MKVKRILPSSSREKGVGANFPVATENEREKKRVTEKKNPCHPPEIEREGAAKRFARRPSRDKKRGKRKDVERKSLVPAQ